MFSNSLNFKSSCSEFLKPEKPSCNVKMWFPKQLPVLHANLYLRSSFHSADQRPVCLMMNVKSIRKRLKKSSLRSTMKWSEAAEERNEGKNWSKKKVTSKKVA